MLRSTHLTRLRIELGRSWEIGETPAGRRRIDVFGGGRAEGERLSGTVMPGSSDALLRRSDGSMQPDVRLVLATDDDALIHISYRGIRHGPPAIMQRIAAGEAVDRDSYYLRTAVFFEAGEERYDWLNHVVAVGVGWREPTAACYDIFEIL